MCTNNLFSCAQTTCSAVCFIRGGVELLHPLWSRSKLLMQERLQINNSKGFTIPMVRVINVPLSKNWTIKLHALGSKVAMLPWRWSTLFDITCKSKSEVFTVSHNYTHTSSICHHNNHSWGLYKSAITHPHLKPYNSFLICQWSFPFCELTFTYRVLTKTRISLKSKHLITVLIFLALLFKPLFFLIYITQ